MKKMISALLAVTVMSFSALTAFVATSKNDYTTLKYGKIADAGTNTISVYGKGFMGTTTSQGTQSASAVLYKKQVDPRNIEFTLEFAKDYGQGEGKQSGWYAFNLSKTENWFSSERAVIKKEQISGVVIIMKLDVNNKKKIDLEINRYSAGSGFVNIFGSTIEMTMKNDWKCDVKIDNGVLKIDGNEVLNLSDALTISIGKENKAYLGFGGFSENHHDIEMKVQYQGVSENAPISSGTATSSKTQTTSKTTSTASSNAPKTSSPTTGNQSAVSDSESNNTASAISEITESGTVDTESILDESTLTGSNSNAESQPEGTTMDSSAVDAGGNNRSTSNIVWIIVGIVAILALIGTGVWYFIYKKNK